ncbi:Hypothetical predicted protein [Pelobates cultripes]|uniref:Uncharacterized protein n=1 Tax=Pelobates cultripes TaxID=61616 RepID=A0AAD1S258_PELCU|nr:Hypothetical predicted protein [Pelobates cultripes]
MVASQSGKHSDLTEMADAAQPKTQTSQAITLDRIFEDFLAKLNHCLQAPSSQKPGCNSTHERPPSTQLPPTSRAPGRRHLNKHHPAAKRKKDKQRGRQTCTRPLTSHSLSTRQHTCLPAETSSYLTPGKGTRHCSKIHPLLPSQ